MVCDKKDLAESFAYSLLMAKCNDIFMIPQWTKIRAKRAWIVKRIITEVYKTMYIFRPIKYYIIRSESTVQVNFSWCPKKSFVWLNFAMYVANVLNADFRRGCLLCINLSRIFSSFNVFTTSQLFLFMI